MEPTTSLGKTLLDCLSALIATLARYGGIPHALRWSLVHHIRRRVFRLDRLAAKWRAGKLPTPRPPRPPPETPRNRKPADPHRIPIPRRKHWVVKLEPMANIFGTKLGLMLNSDEFKQLLAVAPQAARLMRPLAHIFMAEMPEHLKLPERPRKPKPPKPEPEPLVINPHAHVPWGLGAAITRRLRKSGFTIAPRIPKIQKGF